MATIKYNKMMSDILNSSKYKNNNEALTIESKELLNLFNRKFQNIYDCIIMSEELYDASEEKIKSIVENFEDRTGFERSESETRVNDYIENEISAETAISLSLLLIDFWGYRLKELDDIAQFVFILSLDGNYTTITFHKLRKNDLPLICDDLDEYNQPVYYVIK